MYQRLLELIKLIFGKNAINKTIGTRTNVIQLPNNKTKRYIKEDLNIEAASDAAAMNAKKEMEELIAEIPKMNDAERLIFEGNLQRLKNRLGLRSETDPTAEVFEFGTKEKVTPGGIASLTEKAGQKSPPGTIMGNLESRIKQLEASGEDLSKMKGQTLDEIMGDVMQTQKTMSKMQDEGLVRAAVRYKMMDDLKRGTLKLPKNLEDVVRGASNEEDVITVFRNNYGEDALEQVDSLIPDFYNMTSPADAVKKIEKDFPNMKPRKIETKQTMDLDEAAKAEQENILTPKKPDEPEEFATGGRVGYSDGTKPSAEENTPSQEIINRMMAQIKQMSKMGADIDTIKTITGASDQMIKDVLGKASGGSMSKGLDYLTGMDRNNYQYGGDVYEKYLSYLNQLESKDPLSSEVLYSQPNTYVASSGDGGNDDDSQTSTTSRSGTSIGNAISNAISSMTTPKGIGSLIGGLAYGLPGALAGRAIGSFFGGSTTAGPGGVDQGTGPGGCDMGVDQGVGPGGCATGPGPSTDPGTGPGGCSNGGGGGGNGGSGAGGADAGTGPGGCGYATGGIVKRTGFKFGTKFGRYWKIARKVWDDINPTGDRKYDAQLVADELAEEIFKTSMDDLPQKVQIDLYALAYNNAPKVDALFRNPQSLSEAAKKGMAASKEMESLGLDVSKNSDFFKYEEMKLSGQLGPEHQVQAYKDKIRDEFYGVIDDTLMKQVEVDDNPQRLAEVYASIKEGLDNAEEKE
jgi:hypothetical protein